MSSTDPLLYTPESVKEVLLPTLSQTKGKIDGVRGMNVGLAKTTGDDMGRLSIRYPTTLWSLYLHLLFPPLHSHEFSILGVTQLLRVLSGMVYFTSHSIATKYTITTCTLNTLIILIFQLCIYLTLSGYEPCS
jgi:hypothetical protein